ncbi:serine/threonine-protein kinase [Actinocorallia sp. A-T 12471]|uniref:serine/threonine-protein kinase n=1 Tax=Actinocorallia sp. A-T 12471 TaxID=3089813 RepID=UPI0029D270E8|nr:serine/threonine-protein kinase [Actinocorallia sp. A-T 12471]MDX6743776.1 serine/threonine-protein kinase [Actinocorallia sp. A-T 12471]
MEQGPARLLGGRYRLVSEIGRGGMGAVWRARDTMLDRDIAVKEVTFGPGLTQKEKDVLKQRTLREAKASARLNHPNVVTVHDVVEEEGRPWIVMELVEAPSLQEILDAERTIDPWRAAEIGLQVLDALRAAHNRGILHRDVKPSNILITAGSPARVVLTDFGIAQMEGDVTLTQTGLVMGSPAYIPPERVQGERATAASDLWSLGATLFAAVEGYAPYERPDAMAALQAALSEPVPRPVNAGRLTRVLEGLLVREPAARMTGDQALPLLSDVSTSRPNALPTQFDETVLDRPRDLDRPQEIALETVLDPGARALRVPRQPPQPTPKPTPQPQPEPEARTVLEPPGWSLEQQPHVPQPPQQQQHYAYVQPPYPTPPPMPVPVQGRNTLHTVVIVLSVMVAVAAIVVAFLLLR